MTDKRSTRRAGNDIPSRGDNSDKRRGADVLESSKTTSRGASGYAHKVAGELPQGDEKVPADKNEPLPQALAFFVLELQLRIRTINELNKAAFAEFDRITEDNIAPNNLIKASELLEMNALLAVLEHELQRLGLKTQVIAGRFRDSLLDAGIDVAELEERTNKKKQDWTSGEAERIKEGMAKLSKKEMAIRTEILITLSALSKLHKVLRLTRDDRGQFDRIDRLAFLLSREIVNIMKKLDGGELWKVLSAELPK
jgi:hypothetical protein